MVTGTCAAISLKNRPCRAFAKKGANYCSAHLGLTGPKAAGRLKLSAPRNAHGLESNAVRRHSRNTKSAIYALLQICMLMGWIKPYRKGRRPTGDPGMPGWVLSELQKGEIRPHRP